MGFEPSRDDAIALEIRLDRTLPDRERLGRAAAMAVRRSGVRVRGADFARIDEEIDRVHGIMNRALAHLQGFIPVPRSTVEALVRPFVAIADPELILFAEKGGETVGFFPAVPNLNEAFARMGGLRYPWQYLGLPLALLLARGGVLGRALERAGGRRIECVTAKSILVPPEHWRTGVGVALLDELYRRLGGRGYSWLDLSLPPRESEHRAPRMRFGGRIYKRYRLFRKPIATS